MKVILLADVRAQGRKGDVIEVSEGYARNMLIKKKLAVEATPKALNDLKLQKQNKEKVDKENFEAAKVLAAEMKEWKVETKVKSGEGGRVFGSVCSKEIAAAIKKQYSRDIDKKKIVLDEPIKSLGVHEVHVKLHPQVTATVSVHVGEE